MSASPSAASDLEKLLTVRNFLLLLAAVVFLIAWNRGIALLYGMLAMLAAAIAVSYLAPRWMLRGLTLRWRHPTRIPEGEVFTVDIEVSATGWLPRSMVEVWCEFSASGGDDEAHMNFLPLIRGEASSDLHLVPAWRGAHRVGPFSFRSAFPLGVHTAVRSIADSSSEILVLPRTFPVGWFPFTSGDYLPRLGVNAVSMAGGNDLFFGVREYRHGDNPRHIHWPSSARHNKLILKEFEFVTATELCIVLDLDGNANIGEGAHATLEYAIRIAASVAAHAFDHGHHVRLMGHGDRELDLPPYTDAKQLPRLLEALARVEADGDVPYREALREAIGRAHPGSVMLAFAVNAPGADMRPPTELFYRKHLRPVWVQMPADSFLHPVQRRRGGLHWLNGTDPVYTVYCHDDLAAVFARP